MSSTADPVKWHPKGYWYCYYKTDAGKLRQHYLVRGADKKREANRRYEAWMQDEGFELPPMRIRVRPPAIEVSLWEGDNFTEHFNKTDGSAIRRYLETLPPKQAAAIRADFDRFEQWTDSFLMPTVTTIADSEKVQQQRQQEITAEQTGRHVLKMPSSANDQTISDCLTVWQEFRRLKTQGKKTNGKLHINACSAAFKNLIKLIGDKPTNQLTKDDFVRYETHIITTQAERGNKWYNDQVKPIGAILRHAKKKTSWDFPADIRSWIELDELPYRAAASNRQPMPKRDFRALLDQADKWAAIDIDDHVSKMQGQRANNIKQTKRKKRHGVMWAALARLAANCALDNVDCTRITWDHLDFDGKRIPMMRFERYKPEEQIGEGIMRWTPLLPETVEALKAWRDYEPDKTGTVFRSDSKKLLEGRLIGKGYNRLNTGSNHTFKHIKNIAGTIRKRRKLHPEMSDAILGHSVRGTSRFYEGDVSDDYLLPLIDAIAEEYDVSFRLALK